MCGVVGLIGLDRASVCPETLDRMTAALTHRGPDEAGRFIAGSVGLGFRRLSILDLSPAGRQPMATDDGQVVIVFNGEIYNYVELRSELQSLGHRFRSTGDTEVLLRAYSQWGANCIERLNGMWAFLVLDLRRGVVFGSRDRFGIKPLLMHRAKNHILIASEIKAIKASGIYDAEPDLASVSRFLLAKRLDDTERTFFRGIEHLPAGAAFELDFRGRLRVWRYWSPETVPPQSVTEPASAFADLFEDAVELHMRSDVPVAVHLSGGLDSTSIVCASARIRHRANATGPLLAFSYMTKEFDERAYISDTVAQSGAQLIPLKTNGESVWNDLRQVLWCQDEPVHSFTAVVGYQLMRLAKDNGIRVVLNGQGADETIGGYGSYFRHYWYSLLQEGRLEDAWREIGIFESVHKREGHLAAFLEQLLLCARSVASRTYPYRRISRWRSNTRFSANRWFTRELRETFPEEEQPYPLADLNSVLKDSIVRMPLPLYLRIEDRNSMAHSVEVRLPYLDYRLVTLLLNLPADWKLRGQWNKFVLREGMRGRIPETVRSRVDKMGFPVPTGKWLRAELFEPMMDVLGSQAARERGLYDTAEIRRDAERYRNGELEVSSRLFDVVQTELWFQLNFPTGGLCGTTPIHDDGHMATQNDKLIAS